MGRWAQARKRGTDRAATGQGGPVAEVNYTAVYDAPDLNFNGPCPFPAGLDGIDYQYNVDSGGWVDAGFAGCDSGQSPVVLPALSLVVRARWTDDMGAPVSDFGPEYVVAL